MSDLILYPAYGDNYTTAAAAQTAWVNGKDFRMGKWGIYCSSRDVGALKLLKYKRVIIYTQQEQPIYAIEL